MVSFVGFPRRGSSIRTSSTCPHHVSSGASVPPYALAISSVLVCTSIQTVGLHLWCRHCLAHGQRPLARNSVDRQHSKAEMVAEKLVVYCQNWSRIDCQDCRFRSWSRVDYQDRLAWWPMAHKELIHRLAGVVFSPARVTCHPPHQKTAGEGSHAVGCTGLHGQRSIWFHVLLSWHVCFAYIFDLHGLFHTFDHALPITTPPRSSLNDKVPCDSIVS